MTKIIDAEIASEDQILPGSRPTLSALVTTSSSSDPDLLARTIAAIKDHVDEIVIIATGPLPTQINPDPGTIIFDLNAADFPHLYIEDCISPQPSTLAGEDLTVAPTGKLLLASFASARELGEKACSKDYILHLREGEILYRPEYLRGACQLMLRNNRRSASTIHRCPERSSLEILVTSRLAPSGWSGPVRERPTDGARTVLEGPKILEVVLPPQVPAMAELKILYRHGQLNGWKIPEIDILHLATAASLCGVAGLSLSCVDVVLARSADPEIRAWASALRGDLWLRSTWRGSVKVVDRASEWYERSLVEYPTWKAALRLCHAKFEAKLWRECQIAYELACQLHEQTVCLVDDSPHDLDTSLLLSTSALHQLGLRTLAKNNCQRLLEIFPGSQKVRELCLAIE